MNYYLKAKNFLIFVIILNLHKGWILFKHRTPQGRAFDMVAFEEYKKTTMYRERLIHFGKQFAMDQYLDNSEFKFFSQKISFRRKVSIFFAPYTYIERYKNEN
jgi:hypothetical protein